MSIYFLLSCDQTGLLTKEVVKVGYSRGNAPRRLYDVGTRCPFPLELYAVVPGDKTREKEIHKRFAKDHIHKEWFRWTEEMATWVDDQEIAATGGLKAYNPSPEEIAQNAAASVRHKAWLDQFARDMMGGSTT